MTKRKFRANFSGQTPQSSGSGSVSSQNASSHAHASELPSFHTSRVTPSSQPAKRKRQKALQACVPCRKAKKGCDSREDGTACELCFIKNSTGKGEGVICEYQPVSPEDNARAYAKKRARQQRQKEERAWQQRVQEQSSVAVPRRESPQPASASSAPTAAYGSAARQQESVTSVGTDWLSSDECPSGYDTSLSSADPPTPSNGLSQSAAWPFPNQPAVPAHAVPHQQPFYADQNVPVQPMHQIRTSPEISYYPPGPSQSFIKSTYNPTMPQSHPNVDWMARQASNFDQCEQPYQQQQQQQQQQQFQQFALSASLYNGDHTGGAYFNDTYLYDAYSHSA